MCITKTEEAESEAQRGKPKGTLESESRKFSQCEIVVRRAPTALYWCGNVVIDRRSDQLGKVHEERCMKDAIQRGERMMMREERDGLC